MKNLYEIDISHECGITAILDSLKSSGLTVEKYIRNGPAGGNQLVQFSGTDRAWSEWCLSNYSKFPENYKIGEIND